MRVLIVEDSPTEARIQEVRFGLRPTPFRPITVPSVDLALDHLDNESVDVILLDLELPDASGVEAVKAIRGRHPDVPIVVATSTLDDRLYAAAKAAGATDVTRKGSDSDEHLELRLMAAMYRLAHARFASKDSAQPAARAIMTDIALHVRTSLDTIEDIKRRVSDGTARPDDVIAGLDRLQAALDPMRIPEGPDMMLARIDICGLLEAHMSPITPLDLPAVDAVVLAQRPSLERAFAILMPMLSSVGTMVPVRWNVDGETIVLSFHVDGAKRLVRQHPLLWTMFTDLLALSMGVASVDTATIRICLPSA